MTPSRREFLKSASVATIAALADSPVGVRSSEAQTGDGPRVRVVSRPRFSTSGTRSMGIARGFRSSSCTAFPTMCDRGTG